MLFRINCRRKRSLSGCCLSEGILFSLRRTVRPWQGAVTDNMSGLYKYFCRSRSFLIAVTILRMSQNDRELGLQASNCVLRVVSDSQPAMIWSLSLLK